MEVICVYYAASDKTNKVTCVCFETHISKHGKLFYLMKKGYLSFVAVVITHYICIQQVVVCYKLPKDIVSFTDLPF